MSQSEMPNSYRRPASRKPGGVKQLVRSWSVGQLWVATLAIVLAASLCFWALRNWEEAYADKAAQWSEARRAALDTCKAINCDPRTSPLITQAFADVSDQLRQAESFRERRGWLRPLTILLVFVCAPVLILFLHWIWHEPSSRDVLGD